jgi:hypothetical protein
MDDLAAVIANTIRQTAEQTGPPKMAVRILIKAKINLLSCFFYLLLLKKIKKFLNMFLYSSIIEKRVM